jgi:hypothetical protein
MSRRQDRAAGPPPGDLTGRYLPREDYPVDIVADGSRLTFTAKGQRPAELVPLPGGRYRLPGLDCEITSGHSDGLPVMHIRQENTTQTATRSPSLGKPSAMR